MAQVNITDLLKAGVHFGHQTKRWNPKMKPFIYGTRNGITIFDLTITMRLLAEACDFLRDIAAEGGNILFVGAKRQAQETVREAAEDAAMYYMCDRWLGGTLTNNRVVLSRVRKMKELQRMETDGTFESMPKKEVSRMRREKEKLERTLSGIAELRGLPDALVVVDVAREDIAVREANKLNIPVVAVVDSNCDPDPIDYVVPGNDDALRAIKVVVEAFTEAIHEGNRVAGREEKPVTPVMTAEPVTETAPVAEEVPAEEPEPATAEEAAAALAEATDAEPEKQDSVPEKEGKQDETAPEQPAETAVANEEDETKVETPPAE